MTHALSLQNEGEYFRLTITKHGYNITKLNLVDGMLTGGYRVHDLEKYGCLNYNGHCIIGSNGDPLVIEYLPMDKMLYVYIEHECKDPWTIEKRSINKENDIEMENDKLLTKDELLEKVNKLRLVMNKRKKIHI